MPMLASDIFEDISISEFCDDYVYLELELESDSSSEDFDVNEFLNRVTTNTQN